MKITKYGNGQKPHCNIKFTCNYCQSKFVADEFDYTILQKPPEYDSYHPKDCSGYLSPIPGLENVDPDIIEMLAYSPVAKCTCPVCTRTVHKELRQTDEIDASEVTKHICFGLLTVLSFIFSILLLHKTDDDIYSGAIIFVICAAFFYCLAAADM